MTKKRMRLAKDVSREKILSEGLKLIHHHGWSGLSFPMIAKHCRMSPSNIVYHFESREKMLVELLGHISQNNWNIVTAGVKPEFNAYQRLLNHCQKNLEWAREFPEEAQVLLQVYSESAHSKEFASVFQTMIDRAQERIREHLLAGQREGIFHFKSSPETIAQYLHSMLVGAFIKVMGSRLKTEIPHTDEDWTTILTAITVFSP